MLTVLAILTFFQMLNVGIEPYIRSFSGEIPIIRFFMNLILAASLLPARNFIQQKIANIKHFRIVAKAKKLEQEMEKRAEKMLP